MATAFLTDVNVATAALQNILVVASVAHFAPKATSRRAPVYALEATRMLAFVVVLQFFKDLIKHCESLMRANVGWCISSHNLLGSLFDPFNVSCGTPAILPLNAAYIAELCVANASRFLSQSTTCR
jgi:hypothetical protein